MKYKVAIFDFDGTLADTFPFIMSILDYLTDTYHVDRIDPGDLPQLRKLTIPQLMDHLNFPRWKMALVGRNVRKLMLKNIHQISLFDGIDAVLKDLAELGITLVLVSSNSYDNVVKVLGEQNADYFSHFECGVSLFGKNGRYKKVLRKFGVDPSEVISIGDELRDLEASRKVNIPFGAVSWGFTDPEVFETRSPNHIFRSTGEITALLAGS